MWLTRIISISVAVTLIVAGGCGSDQGASSPPASSTSPSPSAAPGEVDQVEALGQALFRLTTSGLSWSFEPAGDVPKDRAGAGQIVYGAVLAVKKRGAVVAFDAMQLYVGNAAYGEAEKDGQPPPEQPAYDRNRYKYVQELPTTSDCVVVLHYPQMIDPEAPWGTMLAVTPREFARTYYSKWGRGGFWIVIDPDGRIEALVEEYVS